MKKNNLKTILWNSVILTILITIPSFLTFGQCPDNIVDPHAGATAGEDIGIFNPNCGTGFSVTSGQSLSNGNPITIDGTEFTQTGTCDGNGFEIYNTTTAGTPVIGTDGYTIDIEGTICEYDASGALIVDEVPTLSEWGLLILALLFMTMGTLYLINNKELARQE